MRAFFRRLFRSSAFIAAVIGCLLFANPDDGVGASPPFDFYVLALSWSPTYCELEGSPHEPQCRDAYGFVVHGLWPQFERGYPEFCAASRLHPSQRTIRSVLDIIPDEGLARYQWDKHGTCSGLTPDAYFAATRQALAAVTIPNRFKHVRGRDAMSAIDVERAFQRANRDIANDAIAVSCERNRLEDVRICLTKSFEFRSCPEVDRRGCRSRSVVVPPTG